MEKPVFEETQRSVVIIIVSIMVTVIVGLLAVMKIIGDKPSYGMVIAFIVTVITCFLLGSQKLKITITPDEIVYSFGIFSSGSVIKIGDVQRMSIIKYDALTDFWGWGVRYNSTTDCYTVEGNVGLEITLLNSNMKILIGTQKQAELQSILQTHFADKLQLPDENKS